MGAVQIGSCQFTATPGRVGKQNHRNNLLISSWEGLVHDDEGVRGACSRQQPPGRASLCIFLNVYLEIDPNVFPASWTLWIGSLQTGASGFVQTISISLVGPLGAGHGGGVRDSSTLLNLANN